jgi:glycerol-3-phosphate O-acyltransferase / dihydroxyacetone phosphate acyltransferase
MWLLPHFARLSTAAVRIYYRASRSGERVPSNGPVLLVGNHPNSLLDPAFLAWVAQRPVRFLAKAPLFTDPLVGWLVRGSGSIPVYRAADDPSQMQRNQDAFAAVHTALAEGSAVGIFPEGISHDQPSLAPIKTGAARIALGAAGLLGGAFPIVPVGLVFRDKDIFRSEAHAVVGALVAWDDLAGAGDTREAVAELTARIDRAMRSITLNLAQWEDDAAVRTAEAIWAAVRGADPSPGAQVARLAVTSRALATLRARGEAAWADLARDVREHTRLLSVARLTPADVQQVPVLADAVRVTVRGLRPSALLAMLALSLTTLLFWLPYRLTGVVAARMSPERDTLSTHKVLLGTLFFLVWILLLALGTGLLLGRVWGLVALAALPALALAGLRAAERWGRSAELLRRWWLLRSDPRLAALRERQVVLADRLEAALREAEAPAPM